MMNNDAYSPYAWRAWTDEELDILRRRPAGQAAGDGAPTDDGGE